MRVTRQVAGPLHVVNAFFTISSQAAWLRLYLLNPIAGRYFSERDHRHGRK